MFWPCGRGPLSRFQWCRDHEETSAAPLSACSSGRYVFAGKASLKTAVPYHRASRFCQSSGSASGPPATAIPSLHTTSRQIWVLRLRRQTHLPLTPCFWRWAEETVQDGDVAAEESCFLLHYVLLQEGGDLIAKQSLVVLPDLPFHFHSTHFI